MSWLDLVKDCNRADPKDYLPLFWRGRRVGCVQLARAPLLVESFPGVGWTEGRLELPAAADRAALEAGFDGLLEPLTARGEIGRLRHERYAVPAPFLGPLAFTVERALVPWLGVHATGVHLNGFVRRADGLHLWIARRARDKPTFPGELDNIVAGGQPVGLGLRENLIKECAEEASIPPQLAARAHPAGYVSYCAAHEAGLRADLMYVYDLELPEDFVPENSDGEVEGFRLLPATEVAALLRTDRPFKFNAGLVVLDWLVRHGLVGPDDPEYFAVVRGLRAPLEPGRFLPLLESP